MKLRAILPAAALAAVALAGCASSGHTAASSASSGPTASATPSAAPTGNVKVCDDLVKQKAWWNANEATITFVQLATVLGWIESDSDEATGQLHTDLAAWASQIQADLDGSSAPGNSGGNIAADCAEAGVTL